MSDTLSYVGWALAQSCRVRYGEEWQQPSTALRQVCDLKLYSDYRNKSERGYSIYDGICVTGLTSMSAYDPSAHFRYPASGLVLSSAFGRYGGVEVLEKMCANCPANASSGELAGCTEGFYAPKTDETGQAQLERIIERLGLSDEVERLFPKAKILWYRFWIASPLSRGATAILHRILQAVSEEDRNSASRLPMPPRTDPTKKLGKFIQALARSLDTGLEMHVRLPPPGHVDLGWSTTFAHCPRCKIESSVERWRKIPEMVITCANCGEAYSPKSTYSSVPYSEDEDPTDLCQQLGRDAYEKLAIKYMMAHGISEQEALAKLSRDNAAEQKRKEELAANIERHRQNRLYVREVMLMGLRDLSRGKEFEEPEWWLSVEDFRIFLGRLGAHEAEMFVMQHLSESGDREYVTIEHADNEPMAEFNQLVENGFGEKFNAHVRVPDHLVSEWWKCRPS